jgi:hypothetical protein
MLKAIPPHALIDKVGPQGEPARMAQAFGRHVAMAIEKALAYV